MKTLSCREARQIPIIEYLAQCGHQPQYIRGNNHWYLSPLRGENHASFKVNIRLNVWYDFGLGKGGNLIDLGIRLHHCSVEELLARLSDGHTGLSFDPPSAVIAEPVIQYPVPDEPRITILEVAPLQNPLLVNYLGYRGIGLPLAKAYCRDVRFAIKDKTYTAVGFENRSGGYELRNYWFKGSSSPKDITILTNHNSPQAVCLVEGFIDFLSLLELKQLRRPEADVIILNSVALIGRSIETLKNYRDIFLFLNHDRAGQTAAEKLKQAGITGIDASGFYQDFNDVNDFLSAQKRAALSPQIGREAPEERSKGIGR